MGRQPVLSGLSLYPLLCSTLLLFAGSSAAPVTGKACASSTFSFPDLFGAQGLSISASPVQNYTSYPQTTLESLVIRGALNFCNVTVTYTHEGTGDVINVEVWLPTSGWNGRYVSVGGGGFATGTPDGDYMAAHIYSNSAAATTDGGHFDGGFDASWALKSPGNLDYNLVYDFAVNALTDLAVIGKAITAQYYDTAHKYSYWHGCSMGGRQGHQMAQSAPTAYDGILANAPALRGDIVGIAAFWPQVVMNEQGHFPPPCEFDAILAAAVQACDKLDGISDSVISRPDLCNFNPKSLVGKKFSCNGTTRTYSAAGAAAANALWVGSPVLASGDQDWLGMPVGTPLEQVSTTLGLVDTICDANNENCVGQLCPLFMNVPRYFILKDPSYNPTVMTVDEFNSMLYVAKQQLYSVLGTADSDLSPFKAAGGKMMTFQGLADQLLSPRITRSFVEDVKSGDKHYQDYFRFYEMPGVNHCGGGPGAYPLEAFDKLVAWVEKGQAPDTVQALDQTGIAEGDVANAKQRLLCVYPKVAKYKGGDPDKSSSYTCVNTPAGGSGPSPLID